LCYVELFGGDILVKIYCLDPSPVMDSLLDRARASVLFSATLTPPEYFCDVLGGAKKAQSVSLSSPFLPENLCVSVVDGISTRAEDRAKNYAKYATLIAASVSAKSGNYIAYFPSYECLDGVREAFCRKYPKVEVVSQSRGMSVTEKEAFLSAFKNDEGHLRVGFCVLSGAFSEGVDLPGSRLIGAIVFGVGIPALSNERNMIQEYFDATTEAGYDYAYTYPGMNHVLQAVGRVIRREGDRGIAVLVDDRYSESKYRRLFPKHWQGVQYTADARSLAKILQDFWDNSDKCE
jgi:Rad3-related DNA helicase